MHEDRPCSCDGPSSPGDPQTGEAILPRLVRWSMTPPSDGVKSPSPGRPKAAVAPSPDWRRSHTTLLRTSAKRGRGSQPPLREPEEPESAVPLAHGGRCRDMGLHHPPIQPKMCRLFGCRARLRIARQPRTVRSRPPADPESTSCSRLPALHRYWIRIICYSLDVQGCRSPRLRPVFQRCREVSPPAGTGERFCSFCRPS